jgi:hypothetical protein
VSNSPLEDDCRAIKLKIEHQKGELTALKRKLYLSKFRVPAKLSNRRYTIYWGGWGNCLAINMLERFNSLKIP